MSFSFSSQHVWVGAAAVAFSGLLVCSAQTGGKERGWPIEFSSPKGEAGTTNLDQLMRKLEGLKQFEEETYQPLQSLAPQSSLDAVAARPTRPPAGPLIQNKRVKELLERRKNWIFMSPEDLMAGPSAEEILKTPQYDAEGREKKNLAVFDRYYEGLMTNRTGVNRPMQSGNYDLFGSPTKAKSRDEAATQEDSDLPSLLKESAAKLNIQYEPGGSDNPFIQDVAHGTLEDTFGLAVKLNSPDSGLGPPKPADQFQSVLGPSWRPPAVGTVGNPLATVADVGAPGWKPATSLPSSPSTTPLMGYDAQLDVAHPVLGPPGLPDVNAQALGQPRPAPALPTLGSTRVAPVAPTFTAPTRAFR